MNCIVFDKTGTLTTGKPVVVSTKLLKNMVLCDFYEHVAAAEVVLLLTLLLSVSNVMSASFLVSLINPLFSPLRLLVAVIVLPECI